MDAAAWLQPRGIDQWSLPFPAEHMAQSIARGEVYLIKETQAGDAAATVTLDREADDLLWTADERREEAMYVHKLTVDRAYAGVGLGSRILDWAGDRAAQEGAKWLRLDAWTDNPRLQAFYLELGFQHVRTVDAPATGGSGWVAQRPALRNHDHGFQQAV
ncbi:GNAT family N-acetyltransferase [Streptomyces sp. NPDC050485]|uniref:GNAT family N-acetyltransferase n=1 Tax=Streptomyces sp. NPDC050485 TaxID=3365617 RepID=UPI003793E76E